VYSKRYNKIICKIKYIYSIRTPSLVINRVRLKEKPSKGKKKKETFKRGERVWEIQKPSISVIN